jgi:hypothetical protein
MRGFHLTISSRRIKHTNAVMALQRISYRRKASNMQPRWTSTTNKHQISSSEKTMQQAESRTIPLTCTGSS